MQKWGKESGRRKEKEETKYATSVNKGKICGGIKSVITDERSKAKERRAGKRDQ